MDTSADQRARSRRHLVLDPPGRARGGRSSGCEVDRAAFLPQAASAMSSSRTSPAGSDYGPGCQSISSATTAWILSFFSIRASTSFIRGDFLTVLHRASQSRKEPSKKRGQRPILRPVIRMSLLARPETGPDPAKPPWWSRETGPDPQKPVKRPGDRRASGRTGLGRAGSTAQSASNFSKHALERALPKRTWQKLVGLNRTNHMFPERALPEPIRKAA